VEPPRRPHEVIEKVGEKYEADERIGGVEG
jgi:hypothetical protein